MTTSILDHYLTSINAIQYTESLQKYLFLLAKWNQTYNLTAIQDLPTMITHHIIDSLTIAPYLTGKHILDVGSGAGLPGIPLAIVFPHLQIELLDSNGKKTRFLQEVQRQLNLSNITVTQARVETYAPEYYFDTIMCRAFSHIKQFLSLTKHLLISKGRWLAMKGQYPGAELINISYPYTITSYQITNCDRCIVAIENN